MMPLNPLTFPLHGARLIEASAGTGKTYTLAALYVRLVLGHGQTDTCFQRALAPAEILVVTFTNAATAELRDRIRQRLVEAAQVFRQQRTPAVDDEFLRGLVADYPKPDHAHCAAVLDLAAQGMDEAAIFTIHGWCQRMLSEHAFYSGLSFNESLDDQNTDLGLDVARDYWRTFLYAMPSASSLQGLPGVASSPEALLALVRDALKPDASALHYAGKPLPAPQSPMDALPELLAWERQMDDLWARVQAANTADACAAIAEAVAQGRLSKTSYKPAAWEAEQTLWHDWLAQPDQYHWQHPPIQALISKCRQSKVTAGTKRHQAPTEHALLDIFDRFYDALAEAPDVLPAVLAHAAQWMGTEIQRRKRQQAQLSFDDLLTRLREALEAPGGDLLAARIQRQFPLAMVDEFQDTDPVQFAILNAIYPDVNSTEFGLVLVGDPKQAIYSFRGADLHTYLHVRALTEGRHYQLYTNFRSSQAMVDSSNRLFTRAESSKPNAAFGFQTDTENPLPFVEVAAKGKKQTLHLGGEPAPAIQYWLAPELPEQLKKDGYLTQMATQCAQQIRHTLSTGTLESEAGAEAQPLGPADIAVLVRNRTEADRVRGALAQLGLSSVYLSDKDSIFSSAEAELLMNWLRAIHNPDEESLLRAALTLPLSLQSDDDLLRLLEQEQDWEHMTERVRHWQWLWRRQGVLPMLRAWLHDMNMPGKWLAMNGGERTLTNVLHLAELLQTQSQQLDGEAGLLRWLAAQMASPGEGDELILRLESDAKLIQVVTMHKSKGLQYPLVFLPFVCSFRETGTKYSLRYRSDSHWVLDLKPTGETAKQADVDRLNEDVRLLYVALTRSIYACWLGLAAYSVGNGKKTAVHKSALGHLLNLSADATASSLSAAAERLEWQATPVLKPQAALPSVDPSRQGAQRLEQSLHRERWWIASYSALGTGRYDDAPETAQDAQTLDEQGPDSDYATDINTELSAAITRTVAIQGLHRFPRGAQAGTFLHGLLEDACPAGFADDALNDVLYPRLRQRGWEDEHNAVMAWWQSMVQAPLQSGGQLNTLTSPWSEMEFWLATQQVDARALDRVIQRHIWPDAERLPLLPDQLNGLLKGFIDLVYQAPDGRYWVLDYKSNWLGEHDADYTADHMQAAMLSKRYDVQGALYLLALHRLLKARQPGYLDDPERYLGGALFWFIRAPAAGQTVLPASAALLDDLDALFTGGKRHAA